MLKWPYFKKLNPRKSKEFWKACNLLNKTTSSIPTLKLLNFTTMAHTDLEKAELLNSFFVSYFNLTLHWDDANFYAIPCAGEPCSTILCDDAFVCVFFSQVNQLVQMEYLLKC